MVCIVIDIALPASRSTRRLRAVTWVAAAVSASLAITLVVVRVQQPGDPAAGVNGQVGLTVSSSGSPVLVLQICRGSIDEIIVVGPNRGSIPNEVLARFHNDHPVGVGAVLLDLGHPPPGWVADAGSTLSTADPQKPKIAFGRGPRNELRQVVFVDADLRSLHSGTVLYSGFDARNAHPTLTPLAQFHGIACR